MVKGVVPERLDEPVFMALVCLGAATWFCGDRPAGHRPDIVAMLAAGRAEVASYLAAALVEHIGNPLRNLSEETPSRTALAYP